MKRNKLKLNLILSSKQIVAFATLKVCSLGSFTQSAVSEKTCEANAA